ncbi:methyl-accepting chemotaxis protein [Kineosporia sp. NBRC 101731]|uniref:methyl-accepting chemotaxis protein n=1 Tax=Kineosporia sp. NBRC 101731 TaxID=3032199 RepID=UPI0025531080|nr:methyl-accepting chemotaxis protein [Kineosporia sp. NBRC 101731]
MSETSWQARHRIIRGAALSSVPVLIAVGVAGPTPTLEAVPLSLVPLVLVALAGMARGRRLTSELTSLALISSAFIGIDLSGGSLHAHLFLLSAIPFVALYQRWSPLLVTVGAVVVHHLLFGFLAPARVMSMSMQSMHGTEPGAREVAIMVITHAVSVIVEIVAVLMWWHFAEITEAETESQRAALDAEREATARLQTRSAEAETLVQREAAQAAARREESLAADAEIIRTLAGKASAAIDDLTRQSDMLESAVNDIARRCQETASTAQQGQDAAEHAVHDAARLETAVSEISGVNAMIESLAEQTNLLSLNATIEAARAGEAGKGFGVVALEVKSLAAATAESTQKVRTVVDVVSQQAHKVADSFRTSNTLVAQIGDSQTAIAAAVDEQAAVLAEVGRRTSEAADAAREITQALERMLHNAGR